MQKQTGVRDDRRRLTSSNTNTKGFRALQRIRTISLLGHRGSSMYKTTRKETTHGNIPSQSVILSGRKLQKGTTQPVPMSSQALFMVVQKVLERSLMKLAESCKARFYKLVEQRTQRKYSLEAILNIDGSLLSLHFFLL